MKRCFLIIGLLTFLSLNTSCKKIKEIPASKDSITILYIGDERIFHQDYWGMDAAFWIFLPLATNVADERDEIQPVLAESWSHSDDYKTWTVHLRKDIYWHDGVQMTAHDVKFSIDLKEKAFGGSVSGLKCELIDDFMFKLIFKNSVQDLDTWEVYYPKHLLEELDPENYYDWDFWKHPVGNGPYKFVRNVPKTMVEVEANPAYFGKQPKIKKAILKFSPNPSLQELLSGNVDVITYAPRDFLFKIEGNNRYKPYYWWGSTTSCIFWNHNHPLFKEATVRKALTMAINRQELSMVLNNLENIPISDVLLTKNQRNLSDIPKPIPYDFNKAKSLLNECGWKDTNSDGILDRDGVDFKFLITVNSDHEISATYIQDNFRRIGIQMEIETIERNIIKQRLKKKEFEAVMLFLDNNEKNLFRIRNYFGKNSYLGYNNKVIDSIFDLVENTGDKIEIDKLYKKLIPILEKDIPITFLIPEVQTHIVSNKVMGLKNLYKANPVRFLESLWIE